MVNNSHYLYRMTILSAVAALAPAVSHDVLCNNMLPVVISCAKDKVDTYLGDDKLCNLIGNLQLP